MKARRTLRAARRLLEQGFVDDAASRLYFAVFQAAVFALERQGREPGDFRSGAGKWGHRMVRKLATLVRGRAEDRVLFDQLFGLRVTADYEASCLDRRMLEFLQHEAERFVREATT